MNYLEKFGTMFEAMKNHPKVDVQQARITEMEFDESLIKLFDETVKNMTGFAIPEHLRPCRTIASGTMLYWWYDGKQGESPGGEISLVEIEAVWYKSGLTWLPSEYMNPEMVPLLPHLSIMDQFPNNGEHFFTAINVPEGDTLYFQDRGQLFKMTLSYSEYLDVLLDLRGHYGWQLLFCEGNLKESNHFRLDFLDRFSAFLDDAEMLFPETNFQKYRARVEELKSEYPK